MPTPIDNEQVRRLVDDEGAQLVEVLPRSSFEPLHLPGAVNLPLDELNPETATILASNRPIVVYCYDHE